MKNLQIRELIQSNTWDYIYKNTNMKFSREGDSVKTNNRSRGQPKKNLGHSKAKARKDDEGS